MKGRKLDLLPKVEEICKKINALHLNDPKIMQYWDELTCVLTEDEKETLFLLENLNDKELIEDISSVFGEISRKLRSMKFVSCVEAMRDRYPELMLEHMVEDAKMMLVG